MMVVTEVNACRYCRWYHSALSIKAGMSAEEVRDLVTGQVPDGAPREEIPALLYARHWAQCNASPDAESTRRLEEAYPDGQAAAILVILRMIRMGNLLGNSLDRFLHLVSLGRLGVATEGTYASGTLRQ